MKRHYFLIVLTWLAIHHVTGQSLNLVKDGTFENENLEINSDFKYSGGWGKGLYTFTNKVSGFGPQFIDPYPATGNYLIVDVNSSNKQRLWFDSIKVEPNTTYIFSCLASNVFKATNAFNSLYTPAPLVKLSINGKKVSKIVLLSETRSEWKAINGKFTSGPSQTMVEISIEDMETVDSGNDIAIDNIFFGPLDPPEKKSPPEDNRTPVVAKVTEKKDTEQNEEIKTVKEELPPVEQKDIVTPVSEPVLVKSDPVDSEVVVLNKEIIKEEKKTILPATETKKTISTPTKVKKTEVKKPITAPTLVKKTEVKKPITTAPTLVKKTEVKKPITAPTLVKKTVPATIVMKKEEHTPPRIEVKKKKEIMAPEVVKKKVPATVVVKKKDNTPVVVKKTTPLEVKKPIATSATIKKDSSKVVSATAFDKNIKKENIYVGQKLGLEHIYFERSKYDLLETSMPELNNLVEFMNHYRSVRIKLEGHTDNVGDPAKNVELSENRVKAVKKYLVDHGIAENRIEWIGHGGAKGLNSNSSESQKKLNRRVEVVIIAK